MHQFDPILFRDGRSRLIDLDVMAMIGVDNADIGAGFASDPDKPGLNTQGLEFIIEQFTGFARGKAQGYAGRAQGLEHTGHIEALAAAVHAKLAGPQDRIEGDLFHHQLAIHCRIECNGVNHG
jgi:hypothetical protein